jgi:hypothetical protein
MSAGKTIPSKGHPAKFQKPVNYEFHLINPNNLDLKTEMYGFFFAKIKQVSARKQFKLNEIE